MGVECDKSSIVTKLLEGTDNERIRYALTRTASFHEAKARFGIRLRPAKCEEHMELAAELRNMAKAFDETAKSEYRLEGPSYARRLVRK